MANQPTTPATVELWLRSFDPASTGPTQERALEHLDDLEATESIESVDVDVWGKEVTVDRPDRVMRIPQLRRIETRLETFESWAERTGRDLEPFFRNTSVESTITGESYEIWRLPTLALAEFDGNDDLLHVAPCCDGDRTIDVFDRLTTLEVLDPSAGETQRPDESTADGDRRTDEPVANGGSERWADPRRAPRRVEHLPF